MNRPSRTPIRTCVSCRTSSAKRELTRIVRTSDGGVRLDPSGKLPGRGAYLCGSKECLAKAVKANKLGRALRCEVPKELLDELEEVTASSDAGKERKGNGE